jgi:HSP20 family molecular chaperone IbpA
MLADAIDWMREAERLQRQFFGLGDARGSGPRWEPPVDIVESGGRMTVFVALPGVAPMDLEVHIDDDAVRVFAVRAMGGGQAGRMRRLEIPFGRFERRIDLPAGRYQLIGQELANGCLILVLEKLA